MCDKKYWQDEKFHIEFYKEKEPKKQGGKSSKKNSLKETKNKGEKSSKKIA